MNKTYNIEKSPLYNLKSKKKLAQLLGLAEDYFKEIHEYKYTQFFKKKPDGTNRIIDNPEEDLKLIQKRIFILLDRISRPNWIVSGTKGKSYVDNARLHQDRENICTIDIKSFYDSTKEIYVYNFFRYRMKMDVDIATTLTKLCTYQGKIPTGTSVSQIIAFWSYEKIFLDIKKECEKRNIQMSLYVDDITLSSNKIIDKKIVEIIGEYLEQRKLQVKKSKTKFYSKNTAKCVTGVIINKNNELKLENKKRKEIIDIYKECQNSITVTPQKLSKLAGKLNDAKQIEKDIFPSISIFVEKHKKEIQKYNMEKRHIKKPKRRKK